MVLSITGTLGLTSLIPSTWRLSASMVLQTTALAVLLYILYKVIGFILYVRWTRKVYGDIPGPIKRHWLFGSTYHFPKGNEARLLYLQKLTEQYGQNGYFLLWRSFQPVISVCAPKTMGQILKSSEPKPSGLAGSYRMLKPWMGEGLIITGGNRWARNRRLLTPAFHFDILKPYINVYNKAADTLKDHLYGYAEDGATFEIFDEISKCTLNVILKCAFSYDKDVQRQGERNPYVKAVTDLSTALITRVRRPWLYPDIIWNLSSDGRQFNKDCHYVHKVAEDVIEKRRRALENGEEDKLQGRRYLDFLDILLTAKDENGQGLTSIEIRNEVDTFMFAGHDTTASAISWILYSLAEHPEYQRKCQDELDNILADRETDDIEWNDLHQMEYITMCIKEGLRLHCPVAIVSRQVKRDFTIGDRVFPKDTQIQVNIWALHHNKRVWERDMEYIPERFSKENLVKMDHYQFVPFSAGPRNCIGQNFAMNEIKTVVSKLLRNFTFELAPGHVVRKRLAGVMRSEDGILMLVKRR